MKVTPTAVGQWHKRDGAPRNDDGSYDLAAVVQWKTDRASGSRTEDDWSTEKEKWLALKHRAQTLQTEGKLVALSDVAAFWQDRVTVLVTSARSVGPGLAPALVGQPLLEIQRILDGRMQAMTEDFGRSFEAALSDDDTTHSRDTCGSTVSVLATAADDEPMG